MSKSVAQIQMDFDKARKQASELETVARKLKSLADSDMQDCMTEIGASWTGENSQKYLGKCGILKEKISKSADQVAAAASTIRTIANTTYQAEMAAAIIAQNGQ